MKDFNLSLEINAKLKEETGSFFRIFSMVGAYNIVSNGVEFKRSGLNWSCIKYCIAGFDDLIML
jgi:hypothetical protein